MISAGFLAGSAMKPYIPQNISKVKGTVSNLKSVKSKDLSISTRDQIRHVKQIAFAIYLTGVLDGDFAPHALEAHPQVDASVGSLRSQHGR